LRCLRCAAQRRISCRCASGAVPQAVISARLRKQPRQILSLSRQQLRRQGEGTVETDRAFGNGRSGIQVDAGARYRARLDAGRLAAVVATPAVVAAARIQQYRLLFAPPFIATTTFAAAPIRGGLTRLLHPFATARSRHGSAGGHRVHTAGDGWPPVIGAQTLHAQVFGNEG
jgi:hypothetical protein